MLRCKVLRDVDFCNVLGGANVTIVLSDLTDAFQNLPSRMIVQQPSGRSRGKTSSNPICHAFLPLVSVRPSRLAGTRFRDAHHKRETRLRWVDRVVSQLTSAHSSSIESSGPSPSVLVDFGAWSKVSMAADRSADEQPRPLQPLSGLRALKRSWSGSSHDLGTEADETFRVAPTKAQRKLRADADTQVALGRDGSQSMKSGSSPQWSGSDWQPTPPEKQLEVRQAMFQYDENGHRGEWSRIRLKKPGPKSFCM